MVDISALVNLKSTEPLDLDMYSDAQSTPPLPKAGEYTLRAPESFPSTAFSTTRSGFLSAQIDPVIIGPTGEGYTVRYARISAKPFKRGKITVSQFGDYFRAVGRRGWVSNNPQELADAVEQTANLTYKAELDWRAYDKTTGLSIEGMRNFPSNGNGEYLQSFPHPTRAVDPLTGDPIVMRANLFIKRFITDQEDR